MNMTEVYVPTHALAQEWHDAILRMNPGKRVQIIRGRDAEVQPGVFYCARHTLAKDLSSAGVAVYQNLCSKQQAPGTPPIECPHYQNCSYVDQFGYADVYIYTHAHLALERGALEFWNPRNVIIDESFFQSLIEHVTVPMALMMHPSMPVPAKQLCSDVAIALSSGAPLQARFAAARGARGELNAAIKALETRPALSPTWTDAAQRSVLANTINFKPVRLLLAQLAAESLIRSTPQSVTFDKLGDIVLHHKRLIKRFDRPDGSQPNIFILDASANREVIEPFFQIAKFASMAVPRAAHVVQCHSTRCSTTSLVPTRNSDPKSIAGAVQRLADLEHLLRRLAFGGARLLLVGPSAVVGNPRTGVQPLIAVPACCELAHFNGVRGIDKWKNCEVVVIIGRNEPPITEVENIARALFLADPLPLQLSGQWQYKERGYRLAASAQGVNTAVHADLRVQAVLEQLRESESLQAVDRLRLIHSPTEKLVILLSNVVLDIDVHETRTWDELINGTRLEQAWDACGGVVLPLNPAWLAANTAGLWPTAAAAKKDVDRANQKGHFSNMTSLRKMSLLSYQYRLLQRSQWSRCLSTLTKPAQVAAALKKLIGQAVVVWTKR